MKYSFDIVGVSPVLDFFHQQQQSWQSPNNLGVEYLGTQKCTLDSFLESLQTIPPYRGWHLDNVIDVVVDFWMNNAEGIRYWKQRLNDAGKDNLLVGRVSDMNGLKVTFESLLRENL